MLRLKIDKPCNIHLPQSCSLPANSSLWDSPTLMSCWGNATLGSLEVFPGFCYIRPLWEDISHTSRHKREWRGQMKEQLPLLSCLAHSIILLPAFTHCRTRLGQQGCSGRVFGKGKGQEMNQSGGRHLVGGDTNRIMPCFPQHPKLPGSEGTVRSCHPS